MLNENIISFDLEIYNDIPQDAPIDFKSVIPSVAAWCKDTEKVNYYWDKPYMTKETAVRLVNDLLLLVREGYKLFGWNILNFDLPVIAYYSGMMDECGRLAMLCYDPMFTILCIKGHYLGLDKVLQGSKLETKLHSVVLNDGSILNEMNGSRAPLLFRSGEYNAVLNYLKYDVIQPLKLSYAIEENGGIGWTSNSGKRNFVSTKLITVKESIKIEKPYVAWMENPPSREKTYEWIPKNILSEHGL